MSCGQLWPTLLAITLERPAEAWFRSNGNPPMSIGQFHENFNGGDGVVDTPYPFLWVWAVLE